MRDAFAGSDVTETKLNISLLRLISFSKLIDEANYYSREAYNNGMHPHHLVQWRNTLKSMYRELISKLKDEERAEINKLFRLQEKGSVYVFRKTEEGPEKIVHPKRFHRHWRLLDHIQQKIMILATKKGMLITDKDRDMDFMGTME